ncbi:uncharacterized protein isoform X2 [Musca autumnalis]|uniref:uncharacterized protein isoform X2 n=1 Tax=Musca autumnalis TaxID=221902 RepID=UPI003CEDF1EE
MSENVSIKTEPFTKDYKQENSNNDTNTLSDNITQLEHITNMINEIKKDEVDLVKMEEFLPENVDESTIDIIKEEDLDEMDEFLSEDSHEDVNQMDEFLTEVSSSSYSLSSSTWKSDDRTEK